MDIIHPNTVEGSFYLLVRSVVVVYMGHGYDTKMSPVDVRGIRSQVHDVRRLRGQILDP